MSIFVVNFVTLFVLMQIYERDRDEIKWLRMAGVAVLPTIAVLVFATIVGLGISPYIFNFVVSTICIALFTWACLQKLLGISAKRSAWFAIVIVSVGALVSGITKALVGSFFVPA